MKCIGSSAEILFDHAFQCDSPLAGEVPDELFAEFNSAIARAEEIGARIRELADAPMLAERARRESLTPKQRRAEDYAKAIASFEAKLHA